MNIRFGALLIFLFMINNHSITSMDKDKPLIWGGTLNWQGTLNLNRSQPQEPPFDSEKKTTVQSKADKVSDTLTPTPKNAQERSNKANAITATYCEESHKKTAELMALANSAFTSDSSRIPEIQQKLDEISNALKETSTIAETALKNLR